MGEFFERLRQRKVIRWTLSYAAGAWVLFQVLQGLGEPWGISDGILQRVQLILLGGLAVALVVSWFHGEKGRQRVSGTEVAVLTVVVFAGGIGLRALNSAGQPTGGPAISDGRAIAVLPFRDNSASADQAYLGAAVAEELMHLLSQAPELRVTSRTSAFALAEAELTIPEIADRLGVQHVLEGTVQRVGDQIRVGVQLVGADDVRLLSRSYEGRLDDLLALQDSVAGDVVAGVFGQLLVLEPVTDSLSPETYQTFLLGRHVARQRSEGWQTQAVELLETVLEAHPEHVPTLVELSIIHSDLSVNATDPQEERRAARRFVDRALAADSSSARAHGMLSAMLHPGDLDGMAAEMSRALGFAPRDPEIAMWAGITLQLLGRDSEALPFLEYKVRHDPLDRISQINLAHAYYNAHQFEDAARVWATVDLLRPGAGQAGLGLTYLQLGQLEEARTALATLSGPMREFGRAVLAHSEGRVEESTSLARTVSAALADRPAVVALLYATIRDESRIFDWLDRLEPETASTLNSLVPISSRPEFAWLEGDPRWSAFRQRVGQDPERLSSVVFDPTPPSE